MVTASAAAAICWVASEARAQTSTNPPPEAATVSVAAVSAGPTAPDTWDVSGKSNAAAAAAAADTYDALYERYLASARAMTANQNANINWMVNLSADRRARGPNDLVTINVVENLQASGTADAELKKSSAGTVGVPHLFGVESKLPSAVDPANLVGTSADTKFKGGGVTTRTGMLTAMLTARVTEVLPNGYLVLEGAREIEINGDRQIVVLTGVARPSDIGKDNVVLSTSIGQLRIRYFGRGLMKDNLKPGFLIRLLNRIF
jgi:flagellar L-ring protein FlgH